MRTQPERGTAGGRLAGLLEALARFPHGAAIKSDAQLEAALRARVGLIVILRGNGLQMGPVLHRVHGAGKLAAVHLDLVDGLEDSLEGVHWLRRCGTEAIITSRAQVVRATRAAGLIAIQRLLVTTRMSLESGLVAVQRAQPDIVEILPGVILPHIRDLVLPRLIQPVLAGGFVRSLEDARAVLDAGAVGITTSSPELWV
ncbi:MAG: glycerol-3-phosphate responsive antiterminator [Candidatus Dormibacteraceae bacterium]